MKGTNTDITLGMLELPTGSAMLSEPPGPEVSTSTSESGITELPTNKHKQAQEENRMLWKCFFETDKNVRGYMERIHRLWIEAEGRKMTKQRLTTQARNIEKKKLLEWERTRGRAEYDAEALNEQSDEVDGYLEVAIEEERNSVDVTLVSGSVERCVLMFVGKEKKLSY